MTRSVLAAAVAGFALAVAVSAEAADTKLMGDSSSGPLTPSGAACPKGKYLAGVKPFWAPQINNMETLCGAMEADGAWSGIPTIGPEIMDPSARVAGAGQGQQDLFCPRDSWVWGYQGYSQTNGINSITQLSLSCRNVKTGAMTTVSTLIMPGVSQLQGPAAFCDESSVATGVYGSTHDGDIIQFGLRCGATQPALRFTRMLTSKVDKTQAAKAALATEPKVTNALKGGTISDRERSALVLKTSQVFAPPLTADGAHVFHCQIVGGMPCGQAPADAFCKLQSFTSARSFNTGLERVRAETLGGQKCTAHECDVFTRIECVR